MSERIVLPLEVPWDAVEAIGAWVGPMVTAGVFIWGFHLYS